MKVRVISEKYVKPENIDKAKSIAEQLVEATLKNDKGCLEYTFTQDLEDPGHFAFIEAWESKEHLDAHANAPHSKEIGPKLNEITEKTTLYILKEIY